MALTALPGGRVPPCPKLGEGVAVVCAVCALDVTVVLELVVAVAVVLPVEDATVV